MFLQEPDYRIQIQDSVLATILQGSITQNDTLLGAEKAALDEMKSYLRARYDVEAIFNQVGTDRNELLVLFCVDITLYHLHSRITPNKVPEIRGIRYEAAIKWLKSVAKGEVSPDLPPNTDSEGNNIATVAYGSNPKRNLQY